MNFQQLVLALQSFWSNQGCVIGQPYDVEKGAGTFNPHTFLRTLGPEPWNVAYVEPSRRPTDGRYGDNPNRLGAYYQFQVILKPSPPDVLDRYLRGLTALGIRLREHDVRFVEDDWESPTLGAWGLGWEVWLDGMEITQFTYFQQVGGIECRPVAAEITYGLERIAMYLQGVDNVFDLEWGGGFSYREIHHMTEVEWSKYNFEHADPTLLFQQFKQCEEESRRLTGLGLVFPAYDFACRASHTFNTLDARGAISVAERQAYIGRIRALAKRCAETWVKEREKLGWPILARAGRARSGVDPLATPITRRREVDETVTVGTMGAATLSEEAIISATVPAVKPIRAGSFVLELGCEEVPASFLRPAAEGLRDAVTTALTARHVASGEARVFTTPRRIVLHIAQVAPLSEVVSELVLGPPVSAAFDKDGTPRVPATRFADLHAVTVAALERVTQPKGEYLAVRKNVGGLPTYRILEEVLPAIVANLPWKKSMRWGEREERFARPLHWMVALLNGEALDLEFAGVRAGSRSWGHRFFGNEAFEVTGFDALRTGLRQRHVILDDTERREEIRRQLHEVGAMVGGTPIIPAALLDTVTGLVESPRVVAGAFDAAHLDLPRALIETILAFHQKMFPVLGKDGRLLPWFLGVSNNPTPEQPRVRKGYEKVVAARLADGAFFWGNDRKKPLLEHGVGLSGITFLEGLGTLADKQQRLAALASTIAAALGIDPSEAARAATLAKADLCSHVVREFPELQGAVGQLLATHDGESPAVCEAIFEHYQPRSADDGTPPSILGACVALADKIDTLAACFGIGKVPTGSADPFALRRAALGVVRTVLDHRIRVPLRDLVGPALDALGPLVKRPRAEVEGALLDFLRGRVAASWTGEGLPTDLVDAVLAAGTQDLPDARARLTALAGVAGSPEGASLFAAWKRMGNIVRKAGVEASEAQLDAGALAEPAEIALLAAFEGIRKGVDEAIAEGGWDRAVQRMAGLQGPLGAFFDAVMVMSDDSRQRSARLALLRDILALFQRAAVLQAS